MATRFAQAENADVTFIPPFTWLATDGTAATTQFTETAAPAPMATPTVTTDLDDYPPGSTAHITASGFRIGAEINFTIEVINPETHAHLWTGPVWDVVDGSPADGDCRADGTVQTQFYVTPDYADTTIRLTAADKATGQTATWIFTDSVSANLNDWANGQAPSTSGEAGSWVNGNLNAQKAHYAEGEAVPFETVFTGLAANTTYSITLTWDTTKAGKHAFDYLTSYNFDWTGNNPVGQETTQFPDPLSGTGLVDNVTQMNPFAGASVATIPQDPNVPFTQASGQFAIWGIGTNATIGLSSGYTRSGSYSGDSNTSLTLTFKTPPAGTPGFNGTVVLAWADHVASDANWGPNSGAASISGSPYHQAISPGQNLSFGSQDHQIASSVILVPGLTITKSRTSLVDSNSDGLTGDAGDVISYQVVVSNTGNETLTGLTVTDPQGGGTLTSGATLAIGASDTFTESHTLTSADVTAGVAGSYINTATATDAQHDSSSSTVSTPVTGANPLLTIAKSRTSLADSNSDGLTGDAGDVISYQVVVSNTGNVILTGLTVTDPQGGGTLTSGATLAIGASDTFTESHTLVGADVTAGVVGSYINTATATDTQGNNSSSTVSTPVTGANPLLTIAKSRTSLADSNSDGVTGDAGDVISYQVVVSNTGNVILTGLTVTDPQGGGTLTSGATLAIGASDTFTESHTLTGADVTADSYINTATATDTQGNNSSSTVSTPVTGANPLLTIAKSRTSLADSNSDGLTGDAGDVISYQVVVSNTGNVILTGLTVTDPQGGGTLTSGATLAIGASDTFTESHTLTSADVTAGVAGSYINTATATDTQGNNSSSTVSTPVTGANPLLTIAKSRTSLADSNSDGLTGDAGDVISYQVVVSNTGNVILTGLTVTDPQGGGTLTSGATLAIGASDTFTESHTLVGADVTAGVAGSYINTATATDTQANNSSSTVSTPVTGANPLLTIAKSRTSLADSNSDGVTGDAGDVISYQVVVSNTGNVILTGLTVTDPQGGGTLTSGATLAIGASDTFTESHTLTGADVTAGSYINTATATDTQGNNSSSTVSTPVTGANPLLTIAKSRTSLADSNSDGLTGDAGDVISYQVVVSNTGNVILTGLTVTDPQGGGTLTSGATLAIGASDTFTESHTLVGADVTQGVAGSYINTATATDTQGNNSSSTVSTPVTGANPLLTIAKSRTSLADSNSDGLTGDAGDVISYQVVVSNTGNVILTGLTVTDPQGGGTLTSGATLAIGASDTFTESHTLVGADVTQGVAGSYINTATATDTQGNNSSSTVSTPVTGANPLLTIAKSRTSLADSNSDGLTGDAGDVISYQVVVSNTGNVILTGLTVTDPQGGGTLTSGATLAIGASDTFTESHTLTGADVTAGSYINTATATDTQGNNSSSTVSTPVTGANPHIIVEKLISVDGGTNWYFTNDDSDDTISNISTATGIGSGDLHIGTPTVFSGETVQVEVVVTNTGNVNDTNVKVTDASLSDTALNNITFTFSNSTSIASLSPGISNSKLSDAVTFTPTTTGTHADTATATATGAGQSLTDTDSASFVEAAPPIVITGSPQFNFPNSVDSIQPKVGGGASFTFNPGGYIYWDLFSPDISKAQVSTKPGSFSTGYANLTVSIVQVWSSNNSTSSGAAIYRVYVADNTASTSVALANNANIVNYSIVDGTGAAASSTNKGLIDLVNSDPLIGNFNNFSNIENALTKPPNNDGFSFPTTTTGNQTQVWLSPDKTGVATGESGATFTDTNTTANVLIYGGNNTGTTGTPGDTLSADGHNNLIDGRGGNDSISVGGGNNYLDGGGFGNNTLMGSTGNDTLLGAYGTNTLTGGGGSDVFILQRGQIDRITDFDSNDQLWIDTFVNGTGAGTANAAATGVVNPTGGVGAGNTTGPVLTGSATTVFNGSLANAPNGAQIIYDNTTGNLYFDPIAGQTNAQIQTNAQLLAILQNEPATLAASQVHYDPPTSSLNQLVQAVAGTPLGGDNAAATSHPIGNTVDMPWNQHKLAASTG